MHVPLLLLVLVGFANAASCAAATAVCAPGGALCVGEATQPCGGPAPYGDGWDGFTGAWGEVAGVEYGAGGFDRCYPGDWAAGAFVNMDAFPLGGYQTAQARFDHAEDGARDCYLSAGLYGWRSQFLALACPPGDWPDVDPGWGRVLA